MRDLKIFSKIFISHTTIGLLSVLTLSFIFFYTIRKTLIQRAVDQLSSINILKKDHIEKYFSRTRNTVQLIIDQNRPFIHDPAQQQIFYQKSSDLKHLYHFDNVVVVDSRFKPLYLASPDTTFLSILTTHSLVDTSLIKEGIPFYIVDASAFNPSGRALLLYVVPLSSDGTKVEGYFIIKEQFQKIQEILYERTGLGKSGESYIAADDSLMRSVSRFFPKTPPLEIEVRTEALINGIKGIHDQNLIKDYRDIEVLSVHRMLALPNLQWVLITEIDFDEAVKPINELILYFIAISLFIGVLIVVVTFFISNAISRPILYLKDHILSLSKGIIPSATVKAKTGDEIGEITNATGQLIEGLKRTTDFANEIGSGNFKASFTVLSEKDALGNALITMRDRLKTLNENAVRLVRERGAALMEGQENERKRIIRELHDGIGQLLTVVKLRLEMMEGQDEIQTEIKQLVNETIAEVRRISYNVMPNALVDFGLEAALKGLCQNIKKYSDLTIDFTYVKESEQPLNFEISAAVFRIVQEGLNNILKHAKATHVSLNTVENDDHIYFILRDNGIGFDKTKIASNRGFGMTSMKERAKLLNGEVEIQSFSGEGTIIEVNIPINKENNE